MSRTQTELKARQQFTTNGEQTGALAAALAKESTEDLQAAYICSRTSGNFANPLFGGMAQRWEGYLRAELNRRGIYRIGEYCPVFGYHEYSV